MNDISKYLTATCLGLALTALAPLAADAASIKRAGLKVAGESTWVPGVQVRDDNGDIFNITTERYANGRSLEGEFQVFPDSAFNVHDYNSVARFVRSEFSVTFLESKGGVDRKTVYTRDDGPDNTPFTADDIVTSREVKPSHDNGW